MTPQLRFPEFTDKWQIKKLGDTVKFEQGVQVDLSQQKPTPFEDSVKFLRIENYTQKSQDFRYISKKIAGKKYINDDEVAVVRYGATAGFIATGQSGVLANNLFSVRSNGDSISNKFLSLRLKQSRTYSYFQSEMSGGAMPALSFSIVSRYKFAFPSKPEQEKIADFLTAVDERIAVGEKKLELLETYKRGVMQKIFSQQIRFKDENGKPYPDWGEKKLGEVCKTAKSGGTPTATNRKYYNGGEIPFLAISDITEQGKFLTKTSKFITEEGLKNSASWVVPDNSIIYSMYASVGLPAINKIPIATSQAVINLIPNDKATTEFLYYFLLNYKRFVHRFVETGTQGNLNAQTVKNIPISLPSVEEQQKIADFLTTLDDKITAEKSKLTAAREFKKALLQRMFV